jgi:hypothetical protein
MADACAGTGIKLKFFSESGFFMVGFIKPEKIISPRQNKNLMTGRRRDLNMPVNTGISRTAIIKDYLI